MWRVTSGREGDNGWHPARTRERYDLLRGVPAVRVADDATGHVRLDAVMVDHPLYGGGVVLDRLMRGFEGQGGHFD